MKFIKASITNFKLLQDINVDFSLDHDKPLTVIRAENASGKTSLMTALQWGLYGSLALVDKNVPVTAAHWPNGTPCDIKVDMTFSDTTITVVSDVEVQQTRTYRLIREMRETVTDGRPHRINATPLLFELTDQGAAPIAVPQQVLDQILNPDLRDVFFTNGDAAMSFISHHLSLSERKSQVKNAIRALLEIRVIEDAIKHVKASQTGMRRQSSPVGSDLAELAGELENLNTEMDVLQGEKLQVAAEVSSLDANHHAADRALMEALQGGDYDELAVRRHDATQQKERADTSLSELRRQHHELFEAEALSWSLVDAKLLAGAEFLSSLHDAGVIPMTAVPVLRDRLRLGRCICGALLAHGTPERRAVEAEIVLHAEPDATQQRLTALFHQASIGIAERVAGNHDWALLLEQVISSRSLQDRAVRDASATLEHVSKLINRIDRADIEEKRQARASLASALANKREKLQTIQVKIQIKEVKITEVQSEYNNARRRNQVNRSLNARLRSAQDVLAVLEGVLKELEGDCLAQVSARMNNLFCQMIAADVDEPVRAPDEPVRAPAIPRWITGASINQAFEIEVQAGQRTLHLEQELNGASQRALTFAFIWALTEVSERVAPRVIDTPFGMMSGVVKQRVLEIMSAPATGNQPERQVVLFLTRSEIAHVEGILDSRAGVVFTLTNSDAGDLTSRAAGQNPRIIRCECNHRQYCGACSRTGDNTSGDNTYRLTQRQEA